VRSGTAWSQQQKIPDTSGDFGTAVAVRGDYAAVGRPGSNEVRVYQRTGVSWSLVDTLIASDPDASESFGAVLAMTSTRIVVGAPNWDGYPDTTGTVQVDQGRVFVFDLIDGKWKRVARLTAEGGLNRADGDQEGRAGDHFGAAVAVDGSTVVVGAPGYDGTASEQGAAYVFYQMPESSPGNGATWTRASGPTGPGRLTAASPAGVDAEHGAPLPDNFGQAVAVSGSRLVIGMPGYNESSGSILLRGDVGAVRTYSTTGVVQPFGTSAPFAEYLQGPATHGGSS